MGKTELLLAISTVGNAVLSVLYSLFLVQFIPRKFVSIVAIFGFGLVFGFFSSSVLYVREMRRRKFIL